MSHSTLTLCLNIPQVYCVNLYGYYNCRYLEIVSMSHCQFSLTLVRAYQWRGLNPSNTYANDCQVLTNVTVLFPASLKLIKIAFAMENSAFNVDITVFILIVNITFTINVWHFIWVSQFWNYLSILSLSTSYNIFQYSGTLWLEDRIRLCAHCITSLSL